MNKHIYDNYLAILREEMIPAMGCTEPIALAYGAARAREVLGKEPERIVAKCSGNIIKNVRCVIIPNSGGLKGIPARARAALVWTFSAESVVFARFPRFGNTWVFPQRIGQFSASRRTSYASRTFPTE